MGLLSYIATSDSYTEPRPKFFKTAHRRLKVLQKRLSKKMKRGIETYPGTLEKQEIATKRRTVGELCSR